MTSTAREQAKNDRRTALLAAAARLFAAQGYAAVSLEEIGAATGVSGPAVYRHFAGKQALLGAVLVEISDDLLDDGRTVAAAHPDPSERLDALISSHVAFAVRHPDVIRVQDRDVAHLGDADRRRVRAAQRAYIDLWADALGGIVDADDAERRLRVQAAFGLINSTPHSTRAADRGTARTRSVLAGMARAALTATA